MLLESVRETRLNDQVLLSGKGCGVVSLTFLHISLQLDGEICHSGFHEILGFQNISFCEMSCKRESWNGRKTIYVFFRNLKV